MRTYRAVNLNVLWFLIALNVVIFVITLLRPEAAYFLALTPAYLSQQPWTIISAMFVHANVWHILVNMISLYFLGSFLIRAAGERSFLAVFFLGGLALAVDDPFEDPVIKQAVYLFIVIGIIFVAFLYHPRLGKHTDRLLQKIAAIFPEFIASRIDMILKSLHEFRALSPVDHLVILSISIFSTKSSRKK